MASKLPGLFAHKPMPPSCSPGAGVAGPGWEAATAPSLPTSPFPGEGGRGLSEPRGLCGRCNPSAPPRPPAGSVNPPGCRAAAQAAMLRVSASTHPAHASLQRGCTGGAAGGCCSPGASALPVSAFQPPWETWWVPGEAEPPLSGCCRPAPPAPSAISKAARHQHPRGGDGTGQSPHSLPPHHQAPWWDQPCRPSARRDRLSPPPRRSPRSPSHLQKRREDAGNRHGGGPSPPATPLPIPAGTGTGTVAEPGREDASTAGCPPRSALGQQPPRGCDNGRGGGIQEFGEEQGRAKSGWWQLPAPSPLSWHHREGTWVPPAPAPRLCPAAPAAGGSQGLFLQFVFSGWISLPPPPFLIGWEQRAALEPPHPREIISRRRTGARSWFLLAQHPRQPKSWPASTHPAGGKGPQPACPSQAPPPQPRG